MATPLRLYTYEKCDTCRKAVKFLRHHQVAHEVLPIRETPPTIPELEAMLEAVGGDVRRLFNTSGSGYKEMQLKNRLTSLSVESALELLTANGNLVKRPFAIGPGVHLVGFKEDEWARAFA